MKKAAIKEGVTYQTKTGNAARKVIKITDDIAALPRLAYTHELPPFVIYEQVRGPGAGRVDFLMLESFATWAHSEDAGTPASVAEMKERIAQLEAALKPFAELGKHYKGMTGIVAGVNDTEVRREHFSHAAELLPSLSGEGR